ncbi:MAG TPA: hypothetical protein DD755_01260 [Erysipelotrichaceae bacterium]|nr:hypothetical protein HMPREF9406_3795 [Clostridium sp. HGF2]EQJ56200.1 hypothetical protein QSI_2370 [Clostridioides difficile P28]MDB3325082.1 hypothetical protein [Clostridioides difficile]HBQ73499.1 hypothetical protein [Erysipelotrichaceae bacterium]
MQVKKTGAGYHSYPHLSLFAFSLTFFLFAQLSGKGRQFPYGCITGSLYMRLRKESLQAFFHK